MDNFNVEIKEPEAVEMEIQGLASSSPPTGGTLDHDKLYNRELPRQHPISAIEGLEDELRKIAELENQFESFEVAATEANKILETTLNGGA